MKHNKLGCFLILIGSFYSALSHADAITFSHDQKGTITLGMNLHQATNGTLDGWRLIKHQDSCDWIDYKNGVATKNNALCGMYLASQHPVTIHTPDGVTEIALPLVKTSENSYSESTVAKLELDDKGNISNVKIKRAQGDIIDLDRTSDIVSELKKEQFNEGTIAQNTEDVYSQVNIREKVVTLRQIEQSLSHNDDNTQETSSDSDFYTRRVLGFPF